MNTALTFRLAVWREWRARRALFVVAGGCIGVGRLLPERGATVWDTFALWWLLPALLLLAASGGSAAPDSFWRGLGGSAWARAAGTTAIHLVGFGLPMLALGLGYWAGDPRGFGNYLALLLAGYGSIRVARAVTSGIPVLLGPLVAWGLQVPGWLVYLPPWAHGAHPWRLAGLGCLGIVLAPWLDARFGAWGAAVGRGVRRRLALIAVLALVGNCAAKRTARALSDSGVTIADFDAHHVLRLRWPGHARIAKASATLEESGDEMLACCIPGQSATAGTLGPHGAYALAIREVARHGDTSRTPTPVVALGGATGTLDCPAVGEDWCVIRAWRADGDAVAATCGNDTWIADVHAGCEKVPDASVAWLGEHRVVARGGVVTIADHEVGRIAEDLLLVGGEGVVFATTHSRDSRHVWKVDDAGLLPVESDGPARVHIVDGAACVFADGHDRCWRPDGSVVDAEGLFIDRDHVLAWASGVVAGLTDGRHWTVPPRTAPHADDLRFAAPDSVLVAEGGAVRTIRPDP
jgi:hypothetical protein